MKKSYNLLILIFITFFFSSCNETTNKISIENINYKSVPDQICYNMEFVFIDSGTTKNIINARRSRVYNEKCETILDSGVFVRFYDANGKQSGTLRADIVNIDDKTKDMVANGNIIVVSDSNLTKLETNTLKWEQQRRRIYTDVYVKITSPSEIIEGIGLESDERLSNYKIYKVTGIKQ